ncbi:hypothetical protein PFICI_09902 [Pestalotiopsis fici W106-1]|uniref:Major facilitator superfamily (MFS) profile domain-containing protein n=1 Tax=Pestalotiopsis fici (strain W106-1 / CGMCC3.15140) TaxID=1229662 RepID=W3WVG9_PESFW|nr:uncharacterized protein PFICI_09902 [Pestalotiopsis fici W106-1]ETS77840.1 hypothetical protein PFICI_09902 [Pestalotiopsis fici W106-1]
MSEQTTKDDAANQPGAELVVGSSKLFQENQLQCIPMPTPDPKDPFNLPSWRKWMAIISMCFFGSLGLGIENIIGHLLPLFYFEYNGVSWSVLLEIGSLLAIAGSSSMNVLEALATWESVTPLWRVALLATLPIIVNGISSFVLVPLSSAIGRRPVLLLAGIMAWVGGIWASQSQSLDAHIAARCFQAFGAGAVEAIIPLIIQDMTFIHQRNRAFATLNASQGVLIIGLGMMSPLIAFYLDWRRLYLIFSGLTACAWIAVFLCVPETRRERSNDELAGKQVYLLEPGETRPRPDVESYGPRTWKSNFGIFNIPIRWSLCFQTFLESFKCLTFPAVIWATLLSAALQGAGNAVTQTSSSVLLTVGWRIEKLGMSGLALLIATPFTYFISGWLADIVSNWIARRHDGRREPEVHLLSIILPVILAVLGLVMYGYVCSNILTILRADYALLVNIFFHTVGSTCINTTLQVFILESYPNFAGPILIVYSSFRLICGFGMTVKATEWAKTMGFLNMFGTYGGLIGALALGGLPVFFLGKSFRTRTAGVVEDEEGHTKMARQPGRPSGSNGSPENHPAPLNSNPVPGHPRMEPRDEPAGCVIKRRTPLE